VRAEFNVRPRVDGRPQLLLLTEYFPWNSQVVFGTVQRLRRHLAALQELGSVDVVFFWPVERKLSVEEMGYWEGTARSAWGLDGKILFVPIGLRRTMIDWVLDAVWAFRGALGFFHAKPSMRTSGRRQARMVRDFIESVSPDLIFAHRMGSGAALLRASSSPCPIILDMDDVEHVKLERLAGGSKSLRRRPRRLLWRIAARLAERRVMAISSCVLVCSELDRGKLVEVNASANIAVVPNSAAEYGSLPPADTPTAVFVGIALFGPNREAILWLVREIWPRVRSAVPNAQLLIVGEGSEKLPIPDDCPGVGVLGFVADLENVYRDARLVVCPLRRGSGTRIKIIEAALNGRAVVSTTVGAEGLIFSDGTEILLADSAADFAQLCVAVLGNRERAEAIGRAAQQRARSCYSREHVHATLLTLFRKHLTPDPASLHGSSGAVLGNPREDH